MRHGGRTRADLDSWAGRIKGGTPCHVHTNEDKQEPWNRWMLPRDAGTVLPAVESGRSHSPRSPDAVQEAKTRHCHMNRAKGNGRRARSPAPVARAPYGRVRTAVLRVQTSLTVDSGTGLPSLQPEAELVSPCLSRDATESASHTFS